MKIVVLVGNPKRDSRTLRVARALAVSIAGQDQDVEISVIDLAEHTTEVFEWPSAALTDVAQLVATSDLVVVASPTYKATYTGLLKAFLDRYPAMGLAGVSAVPVMTGADRTHAMAPEVHLRPLLVELGASVPTRGLYVETPRIDQLSTALTEWTDSNALGLSQIRAAAGRTDIRGAGSTMFVGANEGGHT